MRYGKGGIFIKKKILILIVSLFVLFLLTVNAFAAEKSITKDFPKIYSEQEYNEVIKDISDDPLYDAQKKHNSEKIPYRQYIISQIDFAHSSDKDLMQLFSDNDCEYEWIIPYEGNCCTEVSRKDGKWYAYCYSSPAVEDASPLYIDIAEFAEKHIDKASDDFDMVCIVIPLKWAGFLCRNGEKLTVIPYTAPDFLDVKNGQEYSLDDIRIPLKAEVNEEYSKYIATGKVHYAGVTEQPESRADGDTENTEAKAPAVQIAEQKTVPGKKHADKKLYIAAAAAVAVCAVLSTAGVVIRKNKRKK